MGSLRKFCCLAALAAMVVGATAGTAGATVFTSPAGTLFVGTLEGSPLKGHFVFDSGLGVTTECSSFPTRFRTEVWGAGVTVRGEEEQALYGPCTASKELLTLRRAVMEFHAIGEGNATITASNLELTSNTSAGVPGVHCKYKANGIHYGTLTGSKTTGGLAVIHLAGAEIPKTEASSTLCGSVKITSGSYKIESPSYLDVS